LSNELIQLALQMYESHKDSRRFRYFPMMRLVPAYLSFFTGTTSLWISGLTVSLALGSSSISQLLLKSQSVKTLIGE
jgi:hypothetical protein